MLQKSSSAEILSFCHDLGHVLKHEDALDVNATELADELSVLCTLVEPKQTPIEILKLAIQLNIAPNVVAFRILLTLSITVASGERSFSKLKLIKTYLRSTMSQERLSGLLSMNLDQN